MDALNYIGPRELAWCDMDAPIIAASCEALVKPTVVSTCDLDANIVQGSSPFPGPFTLGHEFVGEVVDIGDAVQNVTIGDKVAVSFQPSCGKCHFCLRGLTANCTEVPKTSMYGIGIAGGDWGGALSDCVRVPFADAMLARLPKTVSPLWAAGASDNIADAWRTVAPHLQAYPGAPVLIAGGASIALYAIRFALALGASEVNFYHTQPDKLALAEKLGANVHQVNSWPKRLKSHPITVDSTNTTDGLACVVRSTEAGGVCTSVAIYFQGDVAMPLLEMYMKGVTFHSGRVHAASVLPEVITLLSDGLIDPLCIEPEIVDWTDAADALLENYTKLLIRRPS